MIAIVSAALQPRDEGMGSSGMFTLGPLSLPIGIVIFDAFLVLFVLLVATWLLFRRLHARSEAVEESSEQRSIPTLRELSGQSAATPPVVPVEVSPLIQTSSLHCPRCNSDIAPDALRCPACRFPLKGARSRVLAAQVAAAENAVQPLPYQERGLSDGVASANSGAARRRSTSLGNSGISAAPFAHQSPQAYSPGRVSSSGKNARREEKPVWRTGQRLGNYRLLRLLDDGAFAYVYLGEHVFLKTEAAIKVLRIRLTPQAMVRFVEEARIIASLVHPHIVRVLEFGVNGREVDVDQSAFDVKGSIPYLVMEYASGGTLRTRHPKGSQLAPRVILPYVIEIADALQHAHNKRLVHCDVKPENLLIGQEGQVLLGDFGMAAVAHGEQSMHTQEMVGTVPYMAPEQIRGKPRPASDQYALAVVVYEWLCGSRPFQGKTQWETVEQHLYQPPPSLRAKLPSLDPRVEAVLFKALSKDPLQRFEDIQTFARTFKETLVNRPF